MESNYIKKKPRIFPQPHKKENLKLMHGYKNQYMLFKWNKANSQINREKTMDSPTILNYHSTEHDAGILQTFEHVWLDVV